MIVEGKATNCKTDIREGCQRVDLLAQSDEERRFLALLRAALRHAVLGEVEEARELWEEVDGWVRESLERAGEVT